VDERRQQLHEETAAMAASGHAFYRTHNPLSRTGPGTPEQGPSPTSRLSSSSTDEVNGGGSHGGSSNRNCSGSPERHGHSIDIGSTQDEQLLSPSSFSMAPYQKQPRKSQQQSMWAPSVFDGVLAGSRQLYGSPGGLGLRLGLGRPGRFAFLATPLLLIHSNYR
jgi:hypothetical protein